jgi:hypothetical protein
MLAFHLVPATAPGAVIDQFAFKFGEAPQDIDQQIGNRSRFLRQFSEDNGEAMLLQIAFDDAQMSDISSEAVNIVYEDGMKPTAACIVT